MHSQRSPSYPVNRSGLVPANSTLFDCTLMSAISLITPRSDFVSSLASFFACGRSCSRSKSKCRDLQGSIGRIQQDCKQHLKPYAEPPPSVTRSRRTAPACAAVNHSKSYLNVIPRDARIKTFSLLLCRGPWAAAPASSRTTSFASFCIVSAGS